MVFNSHGMLEIQIQTNDTTLLGASSSVNRTKEVLNSYQLSFNQTKIDQDALLLCRS